MPVAILSAPAALMLAQIVRHTHNDVLFTQSGAMDRAVAMGLVLPATRRDGFTVPLVLAGRAGAAPPRRIAVTDVTDACPLDGRALLAANDISAPTIIGTATTADAAYLVTSGAADAALITATELRAEPRLALLATLAAPAALTSYAAAVNAHAYSAEAGPFCAWLASDAARPALTQAGFVLS
jgi:ABC-type molybdate transport system substrate-binding protein